MNLQEQFEKETGYPAIVVNPDNEQHWEYSDDYVQWLEQRNKEQVDNLTHDEFKLDEACNDYAKDKPKYRLSGGFKDGALWMLNEIREQLKKSEQ